jgi:hypothetical protein
MADNLPKPTTGSLPPLPSSGMTGRLSNPTTHLPVKKGGPGKIVVMLSSVAKPAPAGTQALAKVEGQVPAKALVRPPALPVNQTPAEAAQLRLSATTHVKFPTKATAPVPTIVSGPPKIVPTGKDPAAVQHAPPIAKPKKWTGVIKLNEPTPSEEPASDSIFLTAPATATPVIKTPQPVLPPPLPIAKTPEASAPTPLHVAPPMLEKEQEPRAERMPQPHLPPELPKVEVPESIVKSPESAVHRAPAMIEPEAMPGDKPLHALPGKPLAAPVIPGAKLPDAGNPPPKSDPIVSSSPSPTLTRSTKIDFKPTLKPAVLSRRTQAISAAKAAEVNTPPPLTETKADTVPPVVAQPVAAKPEAIQPEKVAAIVTPPPVVKTDPSTATVPPVVAVSDLKKEDPEVTTLPLAAFPKMASPSKAPLPLTRAARSKKRRLWELVVFYLIFALTIFVLFFGSLFFCRETKVEGQVIPPTGMVLNNEVWVVADFREMASGISEDLALERTPLLQEIQERQDHVQRAQADVASREERIRLIQTDIDSSKNEMATIGKQARDATQQIWDGEGGEIQGDYQSRMNQLKNAIAARAKSLNLKYEPDDTYQSPEVWANAYRLALYEVPAGVDGVKEHQWLGDQMKLWRDYVKTLDDRKAQLRDKAAQVKTATGPQEANLQAKIDDLQHRIDSTTAEEVPLKAELAQAQAALADAQGADTGLDDKYYKELDALPATVIATHIPLQPNGRFSWVLEDKDFAESEKEHLYWLFSRATRSDGRQYWALYHLRIAKNQVIELTMEPAAFVSTKAILRPNLSPVEQDQ